MIESNEKQVVITKQAIDHLKNADPRLGRLVDICGPIERSIEPDPFTALLSSIVYQQLSFAAANTIWARFVALVDNLSPARIKTLSEQALRECGLSFQKIKYINNIADAFLAGHLSDAFLYSASDDDLVAQLIKIKGIGKWSAEMFMIFCLGRQNVFSYGDLGLRKGMAWLYGLAQAPTPAFARAVTEIWAPYNTVASLYLWELTIQNMFSIPHHISLYKNIKTTYPQTGYMQTPFGGLKLVSTLEGLGEISFVDSVKNTTDTCPVLIETKKQLAEYFDGKRRAFDLPLHTHGTPFQALTWAGLTTIPYGQTLSYGALALRIGRAGAARAIGGANNKNRLPIIIPCHRVTNVNGHIGGYAGGARVKQWLLNLERLTVS